MVREPLIYFNPDSILGCKLSFFGKGRGGGRERLVLFFSVSLKERNLNVKILTEFFCYNLLPILLTAALSNVHSGGRLWLGFEKLHPLFYE